MVERAIIRGPNGATLGGLSSNASSRNVSSTSTYPPQSWAMSAISWISDFERAAEVGLPKLAKTSSRAPRFASSLHRSRSSRHPSSQRRGIRITSAPSPVGTSRNGEYVGESTRTRSPGRTSDAFTRKLPSVAPVVMRTRSACVSWRLAIIFRSASGPFVLVQFRSRSFGNSRPNSPNVNCCTFE